jgi:integral membrane sensor domain MASE1
MSLKSALALTYLASLALILVSVILSSNRYTLTYITLPTYTTTLYTIVFTYLTYLCTTCITIRYTLPSLRA